MPYEENQLGICEARVRAAERLLERKRIGLESAIEALETVGYRVHQEEDGGFKVSQPASAPTTRGGRTHEGASDGMEAVLAGYPQILSADQAAEILGVSKRTVSRLCADSRLPSFKVGIKIRIPKHALIDYMSR